MSDSIFKKFYYSRWFIILCLLVVVFFVYASLRDYYNQDDLRDDIEKLGEQIESLKTEQSDLQDTLAYVQSDDFVEIEARTKLNLRKPGEKIIIVSDSAALTELNETDSPGIKSLLTPSESNYQRWWQYFFQ
jgi:cell division protein FtsB